MKDSEKCLDSQLWHACAGGMVQMPSVNSKVYYFPQGQAEHAHGDVDFQSCQRIPPLILCSVSAIKFMADPETDEVFARIWLVPVRSDEQDVGADYGEFLCDNGSDVPEKIASFAKTLTQSDANNGGGFSVPRYCAETIFPRLDYSMNPPVQTVLAKDVHGKIWKFRHIYRGTPRRHLLTTGWSTFVNQKKLVAGDSIVFLRTENGDLCVGIRRAKRGVGGGPESPSGWNPPSGNCMPSYGGFSVFLREKENKFMRSGADGGNPNLGGGMSGRGRVRAESVIEAAIQAANGQPFEVSYYPRASTPEFCVKAAAVRASMMIMWCPGMRFKMAFETEDSSRISWFMGTISSVHVADPIHWPNSLWRLLQVTWDEPDLLQNVKRVSPWLVELMPTMPTVHQTPFSPSRKKLCLPQPPDFPLDGHLPKLAFSTTIHQTPFSPSGKKSHLPQPPDFPLDGHLPTLAFSTTIHQTPFSPSRKKSHLPQPPDFPLDGHLPTLAFSGNPRGTHSSPLCYLPDSTPAGIQGARHAQFGISLSNPHLNKLQSGLFPASFHRPDDAAPPSSVSTGLFTGNATIHDSVSCLLTIGNPSHSRKRSHDAKTPQFLLFGQPILTEQQISLSYSGNTMSPGHSGNSSSDGNAEKMANLSDGSSSAVHQHVPADNSLCFPWYSDQEETEPDLEIGHCKVFMESVDVGRTLDLSVLSSYEELYGRLADMFSADKSEMMSHVLYRDAKGAVRHTGDEPFGEFTRRVRRLTILVDSSSDNIGRECTV